MFLVIFFWFLAELNSCFLSISSYDFQRCSLELFGLGSIYISICQFSLKGLFLQNDFKKIPITQLISVIITCFTKLKYNFFIYMGKPRSSIAVNLTSQKKRQIVQQLLESPRSGLLAQWASERELSSSIRTQNPALKNIAKAFSPLVFPTLLTAETKGNFPQYI